MTLLIAINMEAYALYYSLICLFTNTICFWVVRSLHFDFHVSILNSLLSTDVSSIKVPFAKSDVKHSYSHRMTGTMPAVVSVTHDARG